MSCWYLLCGSASQDDLPIAKRTESEEFMEGNVMPGIYGLRQVIRALPKAGWRRHADGEMTTLPLRRMVNSSVMLSVIAHLE